jgi:predicted transcriptional regulator
LGTFRDWNRLTKRTDSDILKARTKRALYREGGGSSLNIGQRLRSLRGDESLESVAKSLGISQKSLEDYEAGRRVPRDEVKMRLASHYGQSAMALFFQEGEH